MDDDDPAQHYIGDGGPIDRAIDAYVRGTLRAAPHEITAGMQFQNEVRLFLNARHRSWVESRSVLLRKHFGGRDESQLDRQEFSTLNYLESIHGDLTELVHGTSMECQTAVTAVDASWEHSKRERSKADWQCFGFKNGIRLVVRTLVLRGYLDEWNVSPQESRREGGGPYYSLSEGFLRGLGAVELLKWRDSYVIG